MVRSFSTAAARQFYDRFGARQDSQGFYEDPPLDRLITLGDFDLAEDVFEFGCGTGRLAESLLSGPLPKTARYTAHDISRTMIDLARNRLTGFAPRVNLRISDGGLDFSADQQPFDRIVTTYVLDIMPPDEIAAFLAAAAKALAPGGLLCAVNLTRGRSFPATLGSGTWSLIHRLRPSLVGGCRPIRLAPMLDKKIWTVCHNSTLAPWAIPSEVTVAARL